MNPLPGNQEIIAFQDRWLRLAGVAALAGAFITAAAIVLGRAGLGDLPSADSDADRLVFIHAHSGRLILASSTQAVGFLFFLGPLLLLFRSASARAERMRRAFIGLTIVGPLAFGLGVVITSLGSPDVADKFSAQAPSVEQRARQQADANASGAAKQGSEPAKSKTPDQAASDAREDLAEDLNADSTALKVGTLASIIGGFAFAFGLIYSSLWSMRTGLLTRFWGMLGIAFGLFLVIPIIPAIPAVALWFAVLGLMFVGAWPRPLPPAWAAGEAIPWPSPGQDIGPPPEASGTSGTVEGSGREVSEPPLPEQGAPEEGGTLGETQGQRRKKRKRRG